MCLSNIHFSAEQDGAITVSFVLTEIYIQCSEREILMQEVHQKVQNYRFQLYVTSTDFILLKTISFYIDI